MPARSEKLFAPAFGNRPAHLVGREPLLNEILEGLSAPPGSKERAVVLLGQRGGGKTVLLWEIAERARKRGLVVASPTVASEDMLGRIVEKIQDDGESVIRGGRAQLVGGSVGILGFSAGLQFDRPEEDSKSFQYKLTKLARRLTDMGHGLLILVDELQANSPEVRQLIVSYQELVGEGLDVSMVMAGLPGAVSATLNDKVLTFLNRARKIELQPLLFADVDAFYARAFSELGLGVSNELRQQASRATQGSPYLLQLVGYNIVRYAESSGALDEGELASALTAAQADFEQDVCQTTLAALSGQDVAFLQAMAADTQAGRSRMSDIARRMGVTPDYAQKYRRRLIDAGVIRTAARGFVAFTVPYLGDYLAREANWQQAGPPPTSHAGRPE